MGSKVPGSEITWEEHYDFIQESSGEPLPEYEDAPGFPALLYHVWDWFLDLNSSRTEGPISYLEIQAWASLKGIVLSPFELELIKKLDTEYLTQQANVRRRSSANS